MDPRALFAQVIREKARENASKRQLNYSAALSFQLQDPHAKTASDCKSREGELGELAVVVAQSGVRSTYYTYKYGDGC